MASNSEQTSQEQILSDHSQKINSTSSSDIDNSNTTNRTMSDENRDPSTNPLPTKIRPKPIDARAAAASSSSLPSSTDSPKSATITNISQRLPSTSVEISVGEILSTHEKRASVSIREQKSQPQQQQHHHSSSSCSSSDFDDLNENENLANNKMDLGEATRELTRLLHIGNDHKITNEIHLNPNAPDFTPIDFSPTYRSELAPGHLQRRTTQQFDYYNNNNNTNTNRYTRSRYYSESFHHSIPPNTSTIRPLLSLIPQYIPYNRQSWNMNNSSGSSTSNSWWQQDYNNSSNSMTTTSYHSKAAYPLYSPLMPPLTDDNLYFNRHSTKRQRIHSNRTFIFPNQTSMNRKRSHSGPETPLQPPPSHLNGIHSLTKIMIDLLRMIDPLPINQDEQKPKNSSISSQSISSSSSYYNTYQQRKYHRTSNHQRRLQQQQTESIDVEDVFVDDEIPTTTTTPPSSIMLDECKDTTQTSNDDNQEQQQEFEVISTDTANITSIQPINTDESFYEVSNNDESSSSSSVHDKII